MLTHEEHVVALFAESANDVGGEDVGARSGEEVAVPEDDPQLSDGGLIERFHEFYKAGSVGERSSMTGTHQLGFEGGQFSS